MGAVIYKYYKNAFVERCEKDCFKAYRFESCQVKVERSYGRQKRRNAEKPCAVYHDARDMDGVDGAIVDEFLTQNHPRTLSGRADDFAWRTGRGENPFDLQRHFYFLFLVKRRKGFPLRPLVLLLSPPYVTAVLRRD